jgi:ATPase subunit of ABC transporter with duplicated ATPase domains
LFRLARGSKPPLSGLAPLCDNRVVAFTRDGHDPLSRPTLRRRFFVSIQRGLFVSSLRVHHLSHAVAGRALFTDVTCHLTTGWTGLVGANGVGKSTFLEVLAGQRAPEAGHVERLPRDATVLLVPQRTTLTDELRDFDAATDALAQRWKRRLGLEGLARWQTLSFGEQKRWQLGAALWREPGVLLLDEPTNHLDADATALLVSTLERLDVVGVIVSHDRAVLDRLTTATLRLARGRVERFDGSFSSARAQWRAREASTRESFEHLGRDVERLGRALQHGRQEHEAATRRRSAGARMKSKRDSDARGVLENFRAERAQQHLSGSMRRLEQHTARLAERRDGLDVVFDEPVTLQLPGERCPAPVVARLPAGPRTTPDGRVLHALTAPFELGRDARLAIIGPNGSGKTTLLRELAEAASVPPERVLLMPQDLSLEEAAEDLARLAALEREARGRVLQWVKAFGVDPDALRSSRAPSAGEARLLHLALGLSTGPWLCLLDEPTNHLSFHLIERLEQALAALPCALVHVTHDAQLLEVVAPPPALRWKLSMR